MPPKRPLEENPPSASASDEESESEEEGSEEEQEAPKPKPSQSSTKLPPPPKPPSSSDDEDDDDDEEEEDDDNMEEEKAKPTAPTADDDNEEEDDEDDSESGSGSGSESDNEPVKHMIAPRTAEVKPISSKPMSDIPKSKKPTSTNTAPAKPKRPSEEENDKKRKKKKVADIDDGGDEESQKKGAPAGEEKKNLFQRVWTNEDEIILLNSLKDFKREGHNAANDMAGFRDFVKDSLHIDVTKAQLANKIQRLEKKFKNNASRAKEPGKDPVISKPHEWKSYQLSKEIWGEQSGKDNAAEMNNVGGEVGVTERKRKKAQVKNNGVASPKGKVAKSAKSPKVKHIKEEEEEDNAKEEYSAGYPYLNQSMQILNHPVLPVPPQGLVGLFAKKSWDLIGTSNAEAFDQKWKAVLIAETKAYLERVDVVRDQTKLMLEVLESSDV